MTVAAGLQRMIETNSAIGRIVISDEDALSLSSELANGFDLPAAEIYLAIMGGDLDIMGRPLVVEG